MMKMSRHASQRTLLRTSATKAAVSGVTAPVDEAGVDAAAAAAAVDGDSGEGCGCGECREES